MDAIAKSHELSKAKQQRRNRLTFARRWRKQRPVLDIPVHRRALEVFLEVVADYLASNAGTPPREITDVIPKLTYEELALAAMAPLYNAVVCNWDDAELTRLHLYLQIGGNLNRRLAMLKMLPDHAAVILSDPKTKRGKARKRRAMQYLQPEWPPEECCRVGRWLFGAAFQSGLFDFDEDNKFIIARQFQPRMHEIAEDLTWRNPVILPFETPPPDWTGFYAEYSDRLGAKFIRDWRPQTRTAIEQAFNDVKKAYGADAVEESLARIAAAGAYEEVHTPASIAAEAALELHNSAAAYEVVPGAFAEQHVAAVNRLQRVPLRIDPLILDLVRDFAVDLLSKPPNEIASMLASDDDRMKRLGRRAKSQRDANINTVANDVAVANFFKDKLYLGYNCDRRGRIYALSHLNYAREDHVRAMFRFANGALLGTDGLGWLEINVANCWGKGEDKKPWAERHQWVRENREKLIEPVGANPRDTFHLWRKADDPFQFVSACVELVNASKDPNNFITTLPIGSDGSCNGLQHLAMIMKDERTAKNVNLVDTDRPADIYGVIVKRVRLALRANKGAKAKWWLAVFAALNNQPDIIRKLIKTPAMAFAYSITTGEMAKKIEKVFEDKLGYDPDLDWDKLLFLARVVQAECKAELKKPAAALAYMRQIARECNKREDFVQYISPSGVPCCHRYQVSVPRKVYVGSDEYVCPAVDVKPGPRKLKALNVVAANFVHSLDASHLVRSVNEAVIQHGMDILTVHDCFAVLAPNVPRLGQILRAQMAVLYVAWGSPLAILANSNSVTAKLPTLGKYNPFEVQNAEYAFA